MNQLRAYFLLALCCINIFGAQLADFAHALSHAFGESYSVHFHVDTQGRALHYHTHDGETHAHGFSLTVLSRAFDRDDADFPLFYNLNLLMLVLNALVSESMLRLGYASPALPQPGMTSAGFISRQLDVPTPPPKLHS